MNQQAMTRREWLTSAAQRVCAGLFVTAVVARRADGAPTAPITVTVYKDPSCGCCTKWVDHLRAAGLRPTVQDRADMDILKDSLGVPPALRSCHTAVVNRYLVEGHVPAADIKKLVASAPTGVVGLAVPGMPMGSPGMEGSGARDSYDVIAFGAGGTTKLFARH